MDLICVVGLGYVGLPLAYAFAEKYSVVGYDINSNRIERLKKAQDQTRELAEDQLKSRLVKNPSHQPGLYVTDQKEEIQDCQIFIVTVPTPVDAHKIPDLSPLRSASRCVGQVLKPGDIVIYESTVYPGATEEVCVPILAAESKLNYLTSDDQDSSQGFYCGYSPERINPGDKVHTVDKIIKVTSGSTPKIAAKIDALYGSIIPAGTHLCASIKIAEASKVIENSQRDINIAFVNELSQIFARLNIDTKAVLDAAATKWNFLRFQPGLVGGHCIGVDPYYLTYKAMEVGYSPEIILAGRKLNDNMGSYVASQVIKLMIRKGHKINQSKVLILGLTFKENCPDTRNTRVVDVLGELKDFGCIVDVHDPWADPEEVYHEYGIGLVPQVELNLDSYHAIVLAVSHDEFKTLRKTRDDQVLYDVKGILEHPDGRL